jgi:sulfhydrogenase subunit delta
MGPVTRSGCGAICPAMQRACYACFGPSEGPNPPALARRFASLGLAPRDVLRQFRGITGAQPAFRRFTEGLEVPSDD